MAEKKTIFQEFSKGLLKENPVLEIVLGTCPTLATTTSLESAIGMGLSAAIVLVCSNIVISALRKVIPSKVRIPALHSCHSRLCNDSTNACKGVFAST